ncbi:putative cargo-transport protein ypp1 [Diplogelasinospora grovesii]|uniref:Cargo-transport protein ypp1 n=1 Tax=Diplogelasinospora grovesii TaxID=303347 RepID=A0AAN6S7L4_9PEZI|nr:putative cargo-transport protein ypp1 [Diplogelasinospora grovesii]
MPDAVKGAHYLQLLDDARCEENWDAVPELVRKVRKHAPERSCLTLTAETECLVTRFGLKTAAAADRPPTAGSGVDAELLQQIPKLLGAIETEQRFPEDRFQAKVCLGWVHWILKDYSVALSRLPKNFDLEYPLYENLDELSEWTKVSALKSTYLKANCLARNGQREEALEAFESALPSLSSVWTTKPARQQLRYWAELFLTEYCMLMSQAIQEGTKSLSDANCLASFRAWAKYWAGAKGQPLAGGYGFRGSVPRRQVWSEYYYVVSEILQQDLPFPTGYAPVNNESSARNQLRTELKKIETIYQGLLFMETRFPKAEEERVEVEEFVERVMRNWAILNGRGWREQDLGAGGRESLSHGVLDTLYGAASKTFHSTAILRHLFTVHLAVAEFDLAFKSFESYFDLVKRGKERVEKTGHPEPSLDDDATMLETICACIAALCRYGGREAAEKARALALELEDWIEKVGPPADSHLIVNDGMSPVREEGTSPLGVQSKVPPKIIALSWQSVGLAHAQWARMTFESESRTQIQEKAIQCLRKSLSAEFGHAVDIRGIFALGVLLAEQRKLPVAIEIVKTALLADKAAEEPDRELYNGPYWRERSLIPLWHLLALMLSARQEYLMAARACEGAIEQFKDPYVLFGGRNLNGHYKSEHLNEAEKAAADAGLVDEMDDYERESILEIKMTQLAILELVEGPAVAVNASSELLTLYPRLFGEVEQPKLELTAPKTAMEPPKTSASTLRSITGSVFRSRSRSGTATPGHPRQSVVNNDESRLESIPSSPRPQTTQTVQSTATTTAPAIHVTNEHGDPRSSRRSKKSNSIKRRSESGGPQKRASLRKRDSSGSGRKRAMSSGAHPPTVVDGDQFFTPFDEVNLPLYFTSFGSKASGVSGPGPGTLQHTESYTSNASSRSRNGDLSGIDLGEVESSFASLLPFIQFSQDHNKRRRRAILVKVWLVIAGFYRRAGLFENAQKACAEAQKIVQALETDISNSTAESVSAPSRQEVGWGQSKSVDELLADVRAEKGYLSLARDQPYQARANFETALTHFPDHPAAIVGLSNILMDIHSEKLLPPPAVPGLDLLAGDPALNSSRIEGGRSNSTSTWNTNTAIAATIDSRMDLVIRDRKPDSRCPPTLPSEPLGLGTSKANKHKVEEDRANGKSPPPMSPSPISPLLGPQLPPPYKAVSLPLVDRLAARDRAYMLLSSLTKLGSGWNYSEAWFALARAYEESDQLEKAKDALWWCVELEDGMGVREWSCVGAGGYVLQ